MMPAGSDNVLRRQEDSQTHLTQGTIGLALKNVVALEDRFPQSSRELILRFQASWPRHAFRAEGSGHFPRCNGDCTPLH